ncbi:MAG: MFS transporter [Thermomicrobiales bacterium]|nr:MFS transporter [Thermomicrobiales bacterium]
MTPTARAAPGRSPAMAADDAGAFAPSRKGVAGWILYDLGNTLFSQNMISNYFPVWVVGVMGGSDSQISLVNTVTMALMLGIGPWIGALSDRLPRRLPLLVVMTTGCCLLTAFVGGGLAASLAIFLVANLLFQAGLVIYDALLPAVSTPENRGRVGGAAVGLGYLGSIIGLGIGFLVLGSGNDYQTLFRITAAGFLALALPCFLWVREPPRPIEPVAPLTAARVAFQDVFAILRRARAYPDLVRFLVGRAFYAEAANTIGIFMAVYLTIQLGFTSVEKDRLLLVAILAAVGGGFWWGRVVDRIGPRDALMRVLIVWSVALALIAATGFGLAPDAWLWGIAPLAGFALGGTWAADRPLMIGLAPPEYLGQFYGLYALAGRFAALVGPLIWALVVDGLGWGRPTALLVLLGFVLLAIVILRPLPSTIGKAEGA